MRSLVVCVVAVAQAGPHTLKKHLELETQSSVWWPRPVVLALGRQRLEPENPRSAWATREDLSKERSKTTEKESEVFFPLFSVNTNGRKLLLPASTTSGTLAGPRHHPSLYSGCHNHRRMSRDSLAYTVKTLAEKHWCGRHSCKQVSFKNVPQYLSLCDSLFHCVNVFY